MKCPACGWTYSEVIDSRTSQSDTSIRRRRCCASCRTRFTTYERLEELPLEDALALRARVIEQLEAALAALR